MEEMIAFVKARLGEDEAIALAASARGTASWACVMRPAGGVAVEDASGATVVYDEGSPSREEAIHIARHDPARVLREVELHRLIVAQYQKSVRSVGEGLSVPDRRRVVALAAVYCDHPDYRQEWAP